MFSSGLLTTMDSNILIVMCYQQFKKFLDLVPQVKNKEKRVCFTQEKLCTYVTKSAQLRASPNKFMPEKLIVAS